MPAVAYPLCELVRVVLGILWGRVQICQQNQGRKRQGETSGSNWRLAFNYSGPEVVRAGDRLRPNRPCPTPRSDGGCVRGERCRRAAKPGSSAGRRSGSHCSPARRPQAGRSEEHTSELQSLMRISYAVFCLKKKKTT